MVTLIEFQMINKLKNNFCRLEYLPNLAAAQLTSCLNMSGIKTSLVSGQTRYLRDVFLDEQQELFCLLQNLDGSDLSDLRSRGCLNLLLLHKIWRADENQLKQKLIELYKIATGKREESYLDKKSILALLRIKNGIFELYDFYHRIKKENNLSIINNLFDSIKRTKPEIAVFSLTSNYDFAHIEYVSDYTKEVIKKVKDSLEIPIIAAGEIMPTVDDLKSYIFKNLDISYFIPNKGYSTLPKLISSIKENRDISNIPNLYYIKDNEVKESKVSICSNINDLPVPNFSDFDLDSYFFPKRLLPMDVAPVCYWKKCVFCAEIPDIKNNFMGKEKFLEIIQEYRDNYKTKHIEIQSTCPSPKQMIEYMDVLIKNDITDMSLALLSRLEKVYCKEETADLFYKGGIRYVMWGLESGCQRTLERMNKGIELSSVSKILKNFHEHGIKNMCYVMLGFPGETREHFKETINYLQNNHSNIDGTIITPFNLFKNSFIANHTSDFFIKNTRSNPDNPATLRFELSKGVSQEETKSILKKIRTEIELGKLKISKENLDPMDQFYLDKIAGHDALHHILFYISCKHKAPQSNP